jgi:hypothetical protein
MNQEIRDKIRILAGEALAYFEHRKRHNGTKYWAVEEGAPEWVHKLAFAAHAEGDILPEDFRYLFIIEALEALVENPGEPEILWEPDVYTSELLKWLEAYPNYRMGLVDEAVSELGWNGLFDALQAGQLKEKQEVLALVWAFLNKRIEEGEED